MKIPKTIGACADLLYETKNKRLALQKQVDELAAFESSLKEHIINTLPKSDQTGAAGKVAKVSVVTKEIPQVQDWEAFYKHVKKTGDFELMQRRLADKAIQERWEHGKKVPGVGVFTAVTVSLNKL